MNYDIDLVKKYVDGDVSTDCKNKLENDRKFMVDVINYTNDTKYYYCCSKELKVNLYFIKFLISKFRENYDFIIDVVDYYLDNTDTDKESKELCIVMSKILPKNLASKYILMNNADYRFKLLQIEVLKRQDPNLELEIGYGFSTILDSYPDSKLILNYYAQRMLNYIMGHKINLEFVLHSQYDEPQKIDEVELSSYVISLVNHYDLALSLYASNHLEIIKGIVNHIKFIQKNWKKYQTSKELNRFNKMFSMVEDYLCHVKSDMDSRSIIYYVARKLGIEAKVSYYYSYGDYSSDYYYVGSQKYEFACRYPKEDDYSDDIDYNDVADPDSLSKYFLSDEYIEEIINDDYEEKLIYLNVKRIMMNQIFSSKPLDLYTIIGEEKSTTLDLKPDSE